MSCEVRAPGRFAHQASTAHNGTERSARPPESVRRRGSGCVRRNRSIRPNGPGQSTTRPRRKRRLAPVQAVHAGDAQALSLGLQMPGKAHCVMESAADLGDRRRTPGTRAMFRHRYRRLLVDGSAALSQFGDGMIVLAILRAGKWSRFLDRVCSRLRAGWSERSSTSSLCPAKSLLNNDNVTECHGFARCQSRVDKA